MTYDEAQDYRPSKAEVDREIRRHGHDPADFWAEHKEPVTGSDVLAWLGY